MEVKLLFLTPNAEKMIEDCARTSYLSFDKMKESQNSSFIRTLVKNGHHSVLEHAYATFRIKGVSRATSHQFVRHRLASFTQQSQRYVDEKNFIYTVPDSIDKNPEAKKIFLNTMEQMKTAYIKLRGMDIRKEDARYLLPNAVNTEIVITANLREYRRIFELRCDIKAQWEIRDMCIEMLEILRKECPNVFYDLAIDPGKKALKKGES